jgi:hypothetical protein
MAGPPRPTDATPPPRPRWLKVLAIISAVVVLLVVVVAVVSGGQHGPSRHLPGGDNPARHTPPVQHSP